MKISDARVGQPVIVNGHMFRGKGRVFSVEKPRNTGGGARVLIRFEEGLMLKDKPATEWKLYKPAKDWLEQRGRGVYGPVIHYDADDFAEGVVQLDPDREPLVVVQGTFVVKVTIKSTASGESRQQAMERVIHHLKEELDQEAGDIVDSEEFVEVTGDDLIAVDIHDWGGVS